MSLIQTLSTGLTALRDAFRQATRSPLPEPEIQKEMEQEGWKFQFHYVAACIPYGGAFCSITMVNAPNGDPAWNNGASEEQKAQFEKTVAEKRVARGLKP